MGGDDGDLRLPPHSDEAEQVVLGALLLDNRQFDSLANLLSAEDFYQPMHRAIYSTVAKLIVAQKVADVVTVFQAGGHELKYLNGLAEQVWSVGHAKAYAEIVREQAMRRELMRIGSALADDAMRGTQDKATVAQLIEGATAKLLAMSTGQTEQAPRRLAELMPEFLEKLEARADGKNDAISTGLRSLDRLLAGGFRPGELIVIGARPSMGKSALSLTMARKMAGRCTVLVCSMEDSSNMLVARQVAAAGRVNLADIRSPDRASGSMWEGVSNGTDELLPLELFIDDQPALNLADVKRKMGQVRHRSGSLGCVVVDYVQLMDGDGDNRHQTLSAIAAGLKSAAKTYGVPIILLSQLNREADKLNGPPRLEHLRESGGIEEAADIVALLWREHRRKPTAENKHDAQLEFVKHKNGPTDTVRLWFDGATQRFEDMEAETSGH